MLDMLEANPIVAAIKSWEGLEKCLDSGCQIVFVLFGSLLEIPDIVDRLKAADKHVMVHVDLIDGLSQREVAVDYIKKNTKADGILSTKANLIRYAKSQDMLTIQRFFILDSIALYNVSRQLSLDSADAVEILPGVMPKVLRNLVKQTDKPIIAGGLISDKEDVIAALDAGATAISSSNERLWFL